MLTLIERLEKATGSDRELDARIELSRRKLLFGAAAVAGAAIGGAVPEGWIGGIGDQPIKAPAYTADLGAALTLVPKGFDALIYVNEASAPMGSHGGAVVRQPCDSGSKKDRGEICVSVHNKATPAIALCIAALRAREQMR